MACDLRICSERAPFGVPVARTLGNCLSMANTARMVDLIGPALTRDLLLTGRMIDAREAHGRRPGDASCVPSAELRAGSVQDRGRAVDARPQHDRGDQGDAAAAARSSPPAGGAGDDIIRECYGSAEFKEGVTAFLDGRQPQLA